MGFFSFWFVFSYIVCTGTGKRKKKMYNYCEQSFNFSFTFVSYLLLQGLGNNTKDYDRLALILKEYGVPTVFLKVSRIDWLRNAAGLIDPNYWREALRPRPVLDWY